MSDEVISFTVDALREMRFDVEGAGAETVFGPAGIDMDSMAVAELALRVEDRYGVKFVEEELEGLAVMTIGEFAAQIGERSQSPALGGAPA